MKMRSLNVRQRHMLRVSLQSVYQRVCVCMCAYHSIIWHSNKLTRMTYLHIYTFTHFHTNDALSVYALFSFCFIFFITFYMHI